MTDQSTPLSTLHDKNIVVGITGGIAAYKSADLVRKLKGEGANVQVVMTKAAMEFITPLTMQAVSGNTVHTTLLDPDAEAGMGHIELARWADLVLIAPASADTIARLTVGMADDLLSTIVLATRSPIAIAPAMNQAMWSHPATQSNIQTLEARSISIFGPGKGEQACGDVGYGRMLEPLELVDLCVEHCSSYSTNADTINRLNGKRVVITAGPTREAIDPVRYLSNESSGKMGYALAAAAAICGAEVTLISGPTQLTPPQNVSRINVISATDMHEAAMAYAEKADIFIGAAAVADFRPEHVASTKLKKKIGEEAMVIKLIKNPDIIANVAALTPKPFTVGFAAETNNVDQYARDKLTRKHLDMIIANDVSRSEIGFNSEHNEVTVFSEYDEIHFPHQSKDRLAKALIQTIANAFQSAMDR
ncbi:bifunctional phosphopantothenoylcysteine decarboxylase/phosphopantothenate--cysteine ligase CoaBC [Marinibactrum halimedae]|uniref:Coenzyme A biosynthesis bifunctional protein CoaBC n=1 Tax=Marinibactrum halimedae TaxID=1444977 RepID=A0AA37T4S5_9GAMM|nr:bifunctional phosphopantothenoylcysteine decarboxylase/phosphopantothenate--cysteine ligase CoaBC [Marinibactrum halimedae]MCD9458229.1 bifunctional phosphopantothenoylcysteine decarboxylase/phosphopantothenate--cysteine ligase CoaBC [Marinibactrum halimedae]GLS27143.1 phosphopantothenoylcysteine decarboxylase [Marinibactrum halimedae]